MEINGSAINIERFWAKVDKNTLPACWIWRGTKSELGYGRFYIKRKPYMAHRIAWELAYGQIKSGLNICHHCDNPSCVNPAHLFMGSQKDNIQDAISKGRIIPQNCNQPSGEDNGRATLTVDQVKYIRESYAAKAEVYGRENSQRNLASQFNVSRRTINDILKGRTWQTALGA